MLKFLTFPRSFGKQCFAVVMLRAASSLSRDTCPFCQGMDVLEGEEFLGEEALPPYLKAVSTELVRGIVLDKTVAFYKGLIQQSHSIYQKMFTI